MTRLTSCPDAESVADAGRGPRAHAWSSRRGPSAAWPTWPSAEGARPNAPTACSARTPRRWQTPSCGSPTSAAWPPTTPRATTGWCEETLLGPAGIAARLVHRMQGELGPAAGAEQYESELRERLGAGPDGMVTLDLVVLGIGPDGHVASLFPGSAALAEERALCLGVEDSPKPPPRADHAEPAGAACRRADVCWWRPAPRSRTRSRRCWESPPPACPASLLRRERLTVISDDAAAPPAPHRGERGGEPRPLPRRPRGSALCGAARAPRGDRVEPLRAPHRPHRHSPHRRRAGRLPAASRAGWRAPTSGSCS